MQTLPITDSAGWSRRQFLAAGAAGSSFLFLPQFLVSCAPGTRQAPASALPPSGLALAPDGHFGRFGIDEPLVRKVLARATGRGGDFGELFFQHRVSNYLALEDGEVNRAYSEVDLGCGVRVVKGDQTGFAFTEDLSEKALLAAAATAAAVADGVGQPAPGALQRVGAPATYYPVQTPWETVGIDRKIPLLQCANARAAAHDPRIVKVRAVMSDTTSAILLATSDGRLIEDSQPMTEAYVICVAEAGGRREENYFSASARQGMEFYDAERIEEVAESAARMTVVLFDAAPPPAGEYPVVLAPGLSGILLHEAIGHGMEADFNRKGTSVYADRVGTRIAPEYVTIVDDGTNPHERGTVNVDDEGRASQRTVLVENGILRSYMHDRISSEKHYGVAPTANGRRECYRFPPVPRMRNTYMMNGPHEPEEVIRSVEKGVYAETFTNGQVRIGSGDFSFYLKNGYLIEDGKLTRPVKDANLIGFGPEVLEKVEMVADDLALYSGAGYCGKDGQRVPVGFGLPTTKCGGISVGGVGA